jgi:GxxExxY protein
MALPNKDLTEKIIGCAFNVHSTLGKGFLEKVYENAMVIELKKHGLNVQQQSPINVRYDGYLVGEYYADLFVENRVICELKSVENVLKCHEVQLVNYLAATGIDIGLLINFADRVIVRRKFRQFKKSCKSC